MDNQQSRSTDWLPPHMGLCCWEAFRNGPPLSEEPVTITCPECNEVWRYSNRRDRVWLGPLDDRVNPVTDILTFEWLTWSTNGQQTVPAR